MSVRVAEWTQIERKKKELTKAMVRGLLRWQCRSEVKINPNGGDFV